MRRDPVKRGRRFKLRISGTALGLLSLVTAVLLAACASPATPAEGRSPTTSATPVAPPLNTPSASPVDRSTPATQTPQTNVSVAGAAQAVTTPTAAPLPTETMPYTPAPTAALALMEHRKMGELADVTFLVGEGSEATFTVREQISRLPLPNDAVVRTSAISGEIHLDGRPSVIHIDLHQLSSDQSLRDRYIRQRMFPNDPIASFTVADFGQLPEGFTEGKTVTGPVTGLLTLRGITVPLSFELEARDDGDVLFVLGQTNFTWSDFEMRAPNIAGRIQVTDEVRVEILLAARPFLQPGN